MRRLDAKQLEARRALGEKIKAYIASTGSTIRQAAVAFNLPTHMAAYVAIRQAEGNPVRPSPKKMPTAQRCVPRIDQLEQRVAALEAKLLDPMLT